MDEIEEIGLWKAGQKGKVCVLKTEGERVGQCAKPSDSI